MGEHLDEAQEGGRPRDEITPNLEYRGSAPDPGVYRFGPGLALKTRTWTGGRFAPAPIPAAGSALGSLSSVALSSVRVVVVYRKTGNVGA
jgi:hypothetical protein